MKSQSVTIQMKVIESYISMKIFSQGAIGGGRPFADGEH